MGRPLGLPWRVRKHALRCVFVFYPVVVQIFVQKPRQQPLEKYVHVEQKARSAEKVNFGQYALIKESNNEVVLGERFDATLEDIAEYLN
jgi:hypothetical protein